MTVPAVGRRRPLQAFLASEATGGLILIAAAALALVAANSAYAEAYVGLVERAIGPMTLHMWVNDGLMALFFLLVGLEIKREFVGGELATWQRRRLPVIAAVAGMAVPALLFLAVAGRDPGLARGWAIPAATDIAFAIGVLALLGSRVPSSLKLLLTTIAIVDDMGAVAIIALGYTDRIDWLTLGGAAIVAAVLYGCNRGGVVRLWPYLLGFAAMWLLVLASGVHATIAGVVTAMLVPIAAGDTSPLHRLEHALHPYVAFAIVPLFGFVNAGVAFAGTGPGEPLVLAILIGLFLGKQIGIFGAIWAATRLGIARLPAGIGWWQVYGMALIAGIGFTMSLFIGELAFRGDGALIGEVKIGVLAGSLLSAIAGVAVLLLAPRRR